MSRGSSLGGGSISNYFDSVTGSNEYERQSWRDSFNDGRAAGDLTGNTNARIESERENFQGTTWSGSSTQPSALELARSFVGPGNPAGATGNAAHVAGAGNAQVVMGGPKSQAGNGAGQTIVISGPHPGVKDKKLERIGNGGVQEAPAAISDIGWVHTSGGYVPVPSSDVKERIEDDFFTQSMWSWRNIWGPSVGVLPQAAPDFLDPRNSYFDMSTGGWQVGKPSELWHKAPDIVTGGGF